MCWHRPTLPTPQDTYTMDRTIRSEAAANQALATKVTGWQAPSTCKRPAGPAKGWLRRMLGL
jgi:hypothetical protein